MTNILPMKKKVTAISALAEGTSIRSVERMTGIHRDTIMRLGLRVGRYQSAKPAATVPAPLQPR